jgi:adenine-specific DNA-methyltransferase
MPTLQFKGKSFVQNHHLSVKYHQLLPVKSNSLTDKVSLHDNLIIQGDNLLALKALLPIYAGKIKCIYIDPPYNTGKEGWKYNDNVNSPMIQDWLKENKPVDKEDLTRHDKWLCMMLPRLKLLKELLSEDGVIFIHIDDNEIHRLRELMDEIFGEDNIVANFVWKTDGNFDNQAKIKICHEYVVAYSKNINNYVAPPVIDPNTKDESKLFKEQIRNTIVKNGAKNPVSEIVLPTGFPANFEHGVIKKRKSAWPHYKYDALVENYILVNEVIIESGWSKKELLNDFINSNLTPIKDNKNQETIFEIISSGAVEVVKQRSEEQSHVISVLMNMGNTQSMSSTLKEIGIDFDYPKPVTLSKYIISLVKGKNVTVLDSFAGSGTTAHAILELNKEDGGNRKFILVEMENYANDLTAERIRRVIKGVKTVKDEKLKRGFGGSFSYFKLGKPVEMESILHGDALPTYEELARYVYYTATGEEFNAKNINAKTNFIGESNDYEVYLFYKPDMNFLMNTALTLDMAKGLGKIKNKKRLVFAPMKYLDQDFLDLYRIEYSQLPFEIYRFKE